MVQVIGRLQHTIWQLQQQRRSLAISGGYHLAHNHPNYRMLRSKSYRRSHQPGLVSETGQPLILLTQKKRNGLACKTVAKIVKVPFNLRLVDNIEDIGYAEHYIDWSPAMNRVQNQLEFRTFMN